MIDYKLLESLAMVISEGGFEKAARAMHLTQSAVSQRVKLLEDQAGQVLLVRSTPPKATGAGSEMLRHHARVRRLEGDLAAVLAPGGDSAPERLAIGVNADSLATWFLDAVRPFVRDQGVLLDLRVDDQERTHELLRRGEVVGCVSARSKAVQGCGVRALGSMVYKLLAAPGFAATWFAKGFTAEAARRAPAVIFDRKDDMHNKALAQAFGQAPARLPAHYVPSSERFVDMVVNGLGYGMIPEYQSSRLLASGALVEVAPQCRVPVRLFWHCWNIGSPLLESLTKALADHAWMVLDSEEEADARDAAATKEISQGDGPFGPS